MLDRVESICAPALLLDRLLPLGAQEQAAIARAANESVREVSARRDILRQGEERAFVFFALKGWGCRYKQLPDGRRQIVSFILPDDICDAFQGARARMDHSMGAITAMTVGQVDFHRLAGLRERHPAISRAIDCYESAKMAIQREWATSLGQRSAIERLSHLFCELFIRMESVGAAERDSCEMPLTQTDLADACGLTPVHVNRVLQELRREGLVEHSRRRLVIPDLRALMNRGLFDPSYLSLANRQVVSGNG